MSISQLLCKTETWQPEPQRILVESTPVEKRQKLSMNKITLESIQDCTWEDLLGLSFTTKEEFQD